MAQLRYNGTIFVLVDNSSGYGQPYEISGDKGSYKSGTTSSGGVSTNTNWTPDFTDETLTLYINNAYKGDWCWSGSGLSSGMCDGGGGGEPDPGGEDVWPDRLEGMIDSTCPCSDWSIDNIEGIASSYDGTYMALKFYITMASSAGGTTGGRVTKITVKDLSTSTQGSKGTSAETHNMAIYNGRTNTSEISMDFYWKGSKTKKFQVTVEWATYYDYSTDDYGYITEWYMSTGCSSSQTISITYSGTGLGEEFLWGGEVATIQPGDSIIERVTAEKWKKLASLVSEVTGNNVSTSGVAVGSPITAAIFNNMANALGTSTVSSGEQCTASLFNSLRTAYYNQAGL